MSEDISKIPQANRLNGGMCNKCHHLHMIMFDEDGDPIVQFIANREWLKKLNQYADELGESFV